MKVLLFDYVFNLIDYERISGSNPALRNLGRKLKFIIKKKMMIFIFY